MVSMANENLFVGQNTTAAALNEPKSTQPGHPSVGRRNEYQRKVGRKQAHRVML